jgi:hypothetical protein
MVIIPSTRKRDVRHLKESTIFGQTLQLTTKIRYLILVLDEGLTWKAQVKSVMNKAYRTSWITKGTFSKTWGLKPKVVYWTYTVVIRPMLTCCSTVWWSRITYKVSRMGLSML